MAPIQINDVLGLMVAALALYVIFLVFRKVITYLRKNN
jgi:hypothetical protein